MDRSVEKPRETIAKEKRKVALATCTYKFLFCVYSTHKHFLGACLGMINNGLPEVIWFQHCLFV